MKKIISVALALILCLTLFPFGAFADELGSGSFGDNLQWSVDSSGTLSITGTGNMPSLEDIDDPFSTLWYAYCSDITSIVIGEGVTSIAEYAFYMCTSLKSAELPASIKSIGEGAFIYCISLESIRLPEGLTSIGAGAFCACMKLEGIQIPESVKTIGDEAFAGCESLQSANLPEGLTSLGGDVFDGTPFFAAYCEDAANWDGDLLYMGKYLVGAKSDISSAAIKDGTKLIAGYVFNDQGKLTGVSIPESVQGIGSYAFNSCRSLKTVSLPAGIKTIEEGTFSYCINLKDVKIPGSVTSIGDEAFEHCEKLTGITLPDSVTSIGEAAFLGCYMLSSVNIPASVTSIGEAAFEETALESLSIPASVMSIGNWAFAGCKGLKNVQFYGKAPAEFGEEVFVECNDAFVLTVHTGDSSWTSGEAYNADEGTWNGYKLAFDDAHHYVAGAVTKPTCENGGYTTYTCSCGDEVTADETPALGHDYNGKTCTRCGQENPDYKPDNGNFFSRMLDSIRNIFQKMFGWLFFC